MRTAPISRAPFSQCLHRATPQPLPHTHPLSASATDRCPVGLLGLCSHCTGTAWNTRSSKIFTRGREGWHSPKAGRTPPRPCCPAQSCQPRGAEPWETPSCGLQPPCNLWASRWASPSSTGLAPGLRGAGRVRALRQGGQAGLCEEGLHQPHLGRNRWRKEPEAGARRGEAGRAGGWARHCRSAGGSEPGSLPGLGGPERTARQPAGPRRAAGSSVEAGVCQAQMRAVPGVSAVGRRLSWSVSSSACRARQQCPLTAWGARGVRGPPQEGLSPGQAAPSPRVHARQTTPRRPPPVGR